MPNYRGQGLAIGAFDPQGASDRALPSVESGATSRVSDALSGITGQLAARVGALADQLTGDEGRRKARADVAAGTFKATNGFTIRDRSYDDAGVELYLSNLSAQFHNDALQLFDQHRNDPAGFGAAYNGLVEQYRKRHVMPEIDAQFQGQAMRIGTPLLHSAREGQFARQKDQQNADYLRNSQQRQNSAQRFLAIDPKDPAIETTLQHLTDSDISDIRQQVRDGYLTDVQGEKMIADRKEKHWTDLIEARAKTLKSAEEIGGYREKLRRDFGDGKFDGLNDFAAVDAKLATLQHGVKTEQDRQIKALDGDLKDLLDRQRAGLDNTADWTAMDERGRSLGPAGERAVAIARAKQTTRTRLASMGLDEADAYLADMEKGVGVGATFQPASIRHNNPGAMWPGASARKFGMVGEQALNDGLGQGNRIATFATPEAGAAAQFDLLSGKAYAGKTVADAISTWSGGNSVGEYVANLQRAGVDTSKTVGELLASPDTAIPLAKAMARHEAGRDFPMSDAQWRTGWAAAFAGGALPTGSAPAGGPSEAQADVIADARDQLAKRRQLATTDPLELAAREGRQPGGISPLDVNAPPDVLAAQMRARMAQADAVGASYNVSPVYFRPNEKLAVEAVLKQGGDAALALMGGIMDAGGKSRGRLLEHLGGTAETLGWATMVSKSTGDPALARGVADALAARAVQGAQPMTPQKQDIDEAVRSVIGKSLNGLSGDDLERTKAVAVLWSERELARRGIDPIEPQAKEIVKEGLQRARGRSGSGGDIFGGIADYGYGGPGYFAQHAASGSVQVPAYVRSDKFGTVIGAITDDDLRALPDPPYDKGKPVTADQLRRLLPVFGPGGAYQFVAVDEATSMQKPLIAKSGRPFELPLYEMTPMLRKRVPEAFR